MAKLTVTLQEKRKFSPSTQFVQLSKLNRDKLAVIRKEASNNPDRYWEQAAQELTWDTPWNTVRTGQLPDVKWFDGGRLNASVNCIDRHLALNGHKRAIVWEGEPGETLTWTYRDLHEDTVRLTAAMRELGLRPGDRAAIYMPLVPQAVAAMLACARLGVTHTVVFGGFSTEALKDRLNDASVKLVIYGDFGYRKGERVGLAKHVHDAMAHAPSVTLAIELRRDQVSNPVAKAHSARTIGHTAVHDYTTLIHSFGSYENACTLGTPESLPSEHPLFILYTSGTTGKPKGLVHSTGGYLTGAKRSTDWVFDLRDNDLYWCTADIGWITGHSYLVYGPLVCGASIFMYEGAPLTPDASRFWAMIERHKVSILYTAPTAIRTFMRLGNDPIVKHDLSSLRLLGTVGEPINPEAWMWYHDVIGQGRCPIVDTFWQTETGSIVVSPLPGAMDTKPGSATQALPGYSVEIVDQEGHPVPLGSGGNLVITAPWPSMARTIYGDHERFKQTYFSQFGGHVYFTGDGARFDEDGYLWAMGRVDDVLNVSGHRLGTMEIESALVSHPEVAEAAIVGRPDEIKGQGIVAFLARRHKKDGVPEAELIRSLKAHVAQEIGALARPDDIHIVDHLPKTRSGKIMRRLLRAIAEGKQTVGDLSTLEDAGTLESIAKKYGDST